MWMNYWPQALFVAVFGTIIYLGSMNYSEKGETDEERYGLRVKNCKLGIAAAFIVYCAHRVFDDNIQEMFKPYHRFWRVWSSIWCFYLYFLVFLYFMNDYDARMLWKFVEDRLGFKITKEYHTYDDEWDITFENILDNVDHYFFAHFTFWFLASMILRDVYMLHFWSVLDEILELSAQYKLPHFREWWWDHVFHDVLITNTPAIFLGVYWSQKIGLRTYDWLGRLGKKRFVDWEWWNDYYKFGGVAQVYMIISLNFLCNFFLINALWIPPKSIPTLTRVFIWFLLSNLQFKEGFNLIESKDDPDRKDIRYDPYFRWVTYGIILLEVAISFKFNQDTGNLTDETMSPIVFYGWLAVFAFIAYYYSYLRWIRKTDQEVQLKHKKSKPAEVMTPRRSARLSSAKKNK